MTVECSYNCSEHPQEVQFDPDITGTGVLVGYTVTAGLVIIIITVHYILSYRPTLDPFRRADGTVEPNVSFHPNPIDMMILGAVRRKPKSLARGLESNHWNWSRLDSSLMKCVLSMSDLQIATGIAILVSGYAQLPCGLSCYHWQVVGRLAWFSSLTHLSCLTMLRNYLHNRPGQRQWRMLAMLVLVIMLVLAMVPTGSYEWAVTQDQSSPGPSDYAVCHLFQPPLMGSAATISMLIFVLLSILGFLIRVVKLHKPLSIVLVARPRKILSRHARNILRRLYEQLKSPSRRMAGTVCYVPALALFLAMRVILDHWASMYFEVYWLVVSFLYGLCSLLVEINVLTVGGIIEPIIQSNYSNSWSFGQIMPMVLLAVPFITMVELLYPDETSAGGDVSSQSNEPHMHPGSSTISTQNLALQGAWPESPFTLDPDQDYYHHSTALKAGNLYLMLVELVLGTVVLFVISSRDSIARYLVDHPWQRIIAYVYCLLLLVILFSFLIDWAVAQKALRRYVRQSRLLVMLHTLHAAIIISTGYVLFMLGGF